jgi:hypothetical protein
MGGSGLRLLVAPPKEAFVVDDGINRVEEEEGDVEGDEGGKREGRTGEVEGA